MKDKKSKFNILLTVVVVAVFILFFATVLSHHKKQINSFQYVNATPEQILKIEPRAILFIDYYGPETNYDIGKAEMKMLIGSQEGFEELTGKKYEFTKIKQDEKWVARIHYKYKQAIEKGKGQLTDSDARVIFIADKGYMLRFVYDDKAVYNEHLRSKELYQDLDEIGFIEHETSVMPKLKKLNEK